MVKYDRFEGLHDEQLYNGYLIYQREYNHDTIPI